MGARMAGASIIAGIDYWNIASASYSKNFTSARTIATDIRKVHPKRLHELIGEIELMVASPDCTDHSCAKGSRTRNEKSKLTAFQVVRFAEEFRPKWIVIENVVQMKSWDRHQELMEELCKLNYLLKEEKLNSQDFGVPQSRRRLFLICTLRKPFDFTIRASENIRPASSIIDFNGSYSFTPLFASKRASATIERAKRAISILGTREPFLIVYYGSDGGGGWQSLDRPLRTITTIDRFAFVKPSTTGHIIRMLQPEELKLGMGFPKNYELKVGTRRDRIKLMGNAVCPPVMKAIIETLIEHDA